MYAVDQGLIGGARVRARSLRSFSRAILARSEARGWTAPAALIATRIRCEEHARTRAHRKYLREARKSGPSPAPPKRDRKSRSNPAPQQEEESDILHRVTSNGFDSHSRFGASGYEISYDRIVRIVKKRAADFYILDALST